MPGPQFGHGARSSCDGQVMTGPTTRIVEDWTEPFFFVLYFFEDDPVCIENLL